MSQQSVLAKLRLIPDFNNSMADMLIKLSPAKDVDELLKKKFDSLLEIQSMTGCGKITSDEKKELVILQAYFSKIKSGEVK